VGEANRSVAATASGPACSSILLASGFAFDDNAQRLARLPRNGMSGCSPLQRRDAAMQVRPTVPETSLYPAIKHFLELAGLM
jgi:hypothetical protein